MLIRLASDHGQHRPPVITTDLPLTLRVSKPSSQVTGPLLEYRSMIVKFAKADRLFQCGSFSQSKASQKKVELYLYHRCLSQGPGKRRTHQTPQARRDSTPPTLLLQSFITLLTTVRFASNFDMSSIRESHIQHAIQDLTVGRFESIRAATKAYNFVEFTLQRRYQNKSVSYSVTRETT